MHHPLTRAKDALIQGSEPASALMGLIAARIEEHRDTLEDRDDPNARGAIRELRELRRLLWPKTVPKKTDVNDY